MRKLILPLFLLSSANIFAQPTITQAQFTLAIGDVITSYPQTYAVPSIGASQTWNYTGFTTTGPTNATIINSASSTVTGLPASTLCYQIGGVEDCYLIDAVGMHRTGLTDATTDIPYNVNIETILNFPVTFGSSTVDAFRGTYIASGNPAIRSGTDSVTVVGYGTLNLPASVTISNVMLVKTKEVGKDSIDFGGFWIVGNTTVTVYNFYAAGYKGSIVTMTDIVSDIIPPSQSGKYSIANLTGVETFDMSNNLDIYPNPAENHFILTNNGNIEISGFKYSIVNMQGQIMKTGIINGDYLNFDVSTMSTGLYILNINGEHFNASKRFIKK